MGIFGRMRDILHANLNDMLDRAEQPEKMLKQIIREIESSIDRSKADTARVLADAKRLEREADQKNDEVEQWQHRAETAVEQDEDDLARKALERKKLHQDELDALVRQLDQTRDAADEMKENTRLLLDKPTEARARFTSLSARSKAAKTAKDVQKQAGKLDDRDKVLGKLDAFDRRVQDMEAEASALADVHDAGDEVERAFADREQMRAVEHELAALKAKRDGTHEA